MRNTPLSLAAVAGLAAGLVFREACPKVEREVIHTPPEIITRWDTVTQIDTQWVTKLRVQRETINLTREVRVMVPETIAHVPAVVGASAVQAPLGYGDTARVFGFKLGPAGEGRGEWQTWESRHFVTGPFRSLILDSIPPVVSFWPLPRESKSCGLWCKAKVVLYSSPFIVLAWELTH